MQFSDTQDDFYQLNYDWYKAKLKRFNATPEYETELKILYGTLVHLSLGSQVQTVLDYGCGTGHAMEFLSYFEVFGYDIFDYYEGDRRKYNQAFVMFDAVYLMHSINHIPDLNRAIKSIYNQLKDGGFVIVITPDPNYLAPDYKPDPTVIEYLNDAEIKQIFFGHGFILNKHTSITHPNNIHRMMLIFQKQ